MTDISNLRTPCYEDSLFAILMPSPHVATSNMPRAISVAHGSKCSPAPNSVEPDPGHHNHRSRCIFQHEEGSPEMSC